jgi:predicted deacylase
MFGQIHISSLRLLLLALICHLASISLEAQWTKAAGFDDSDMALDLDEALNFQKYPTYNQYLSLMQGFAADHPEICRLDTFGVTVQGRHLLALKISDHVEDDEEEAAFLYTSSMHGNEIVGYVLLLRLADTLLNGYGSDGEITTLVDNLQIWINPLANPDGSFSNDNNLSLEHAQRMNREGIDMNREGIDLNRDFPNPGAGEVDDTTGRALESRFMMEFLKEHRFTLSANIHSGTEVVNYPWDHTFDLHADDDWYRFISHEYADEAMAVDPDYMFGWPDGGITNGAEWYIANGTRQDYVNYYLGGREVTLELSMEYLLDSDELEQHWNINQRSLINYMSQCLYGIRGKVTDLESSNPLEARIEIIDHDSSYSVVYSSENHGDYYRLIKEGFYDLVVSAPGYYNDTLLDVAVTDYQSTFLDIQLQSYGVSVPQQEAPVFRIYPNPAVNSFVVEPVMLPYGELELLVHSMDGRMIYQNTVSYHGGGIEFSTQEMESGIYLVRCSSGKHTEVHRLMVIKY